MSKVYQIIGSIITLCCISWAAHAEYTISLQEYIAPNGDCRANVYITVEGNAGPFEVGLYHLDFPDVAYGTFGNVSTGTTLQYEMYNVVNMFTVRIEDSFGCIYEEEIQYDCDCETLNVNFSESGMTHPLTCDDGDYSGSYSKLQQFVFNGSSPYSFDWGDPNVVDNTWSFDGFAHGVYVVTVTDENDCTATDRVEFIAQNAPGYSSDITKPCKGIPNGEIFLISEGTSMTWSTGDVTTDPSITLSNLGPGEYCVTITDNISQCEIEHCIELEEKPDCGDFEIAVDDIILVKSCKDEPTGSATVPATGGNPFPGSSAIEVNCNSTSYTYSWGIIENNGVVLLPNETFNTISGVYAGMYSVTATDQCGREVMHTVEVEEHPEIEATLTAIIGCPGEGMLNVVPESGAGGPYNIHWPHDPNNTSNMLTGLDQGDYSVQITDIAGCMKEFMAFVPNHPEMLLTLSIDQEVCFVPDGLEPYVVKETIQEGILNLNVNWIGGTGSTNLSATYQWNDSNNSTSANLVGINDLDFANGQNSRTFIVTVTDQNGCTNSSSIIVENKITSRKFNTELANCGVEFLCNGQVERSFSIDDFIECDVFSEENCGFLECFCDYSYNSNYQAIEPLGGLMQFPMNLPQVEENQDILPIIGENCVDTKNCPFFSNVTVPNKPGYTSPFGGTNSINRNPCPIEITNVSPNPYDFVNDTEGVEIDFFVPEGDGTVLITCTDLGFTNSQHYIEGIHSVTIPKVNLTETGEFEIRLEFGTEVRIETLVIDCFFDYTWSTTPLASSSDNDIISFVTPPNGANIVYDISHIVDNSPVIFYSITLEAMGCAENNILVDISEVEWPANVSVYSTSLSLNGETITRPLLLNNFNTGTDVVTRSSFVNFEVNVHPNPTDGSIYIDSNTNEKLNVKIFSALGTLIFDGTNISKTMSLNISDFEDGTYIIEISCSQGKIYKKIIKI